MIATAIILGVTAALIATIAVFWRNIVEWMKKAIKKLQDVLGIAIEGSKTFIKRTTDKIQNVSKYYNKNKITGEWEENIYTKDVSESEIPDYILKQVKKSNIDQEIETTKQLELELKN